jgi:rhomboid family GlyGly-CTERM serine protease
MNPSNTDRAARSWFRSANCDARYGAALLIVLAVLIVIAAIGEPGRAALSYDRGALARFEWWRLLSAHLVHLGWRHTLLNAAGLVTLWILFAREFTPARWAWIGLLSCLSIDLGLWFLRPEVIWYLGASGVLHGCWSAGACAMYRRGDALGGALLLLLVVKMVYEQQSGASVFDGELPLVAIAHVLGALGGLVAAVVPRPAAKPL